MTPDLTVLALAAGMHLAAKEGRVVFPPGWPNPCSQDEPAPLRTLTAEDIGKALTRASVRRAWYGDVNAPALARATLSRGITIAGSLQYSFAETIDFLDEIVEIPPP